VKPIQNKIDSSSVCGTHPGIHPRMVKQTVEDRIKKENGNRESTWRSVTQLSLQNHRRPSMRAVKLVDCY